MKKMYLGLKVEILKVTVGIIVMFLFGAMGMYVLVHLEELLQANLWNVFWAPFAAFLGPIGVVMSIYVTWVSIHDLGWLMNVHPELVWED